MARGNSTMKDIDEQLLPKSEYFRAIKGDIRIFNLTEYWQEVAEGLDGKIKDPLWRPKKIMHRFLFKRHQKLEEIHEFIAGRVFHEIDPKELGAYDIVVKVVRRDTKRKLNLKK
jgi:hypothetical protein